MIVSPHIDRLPSGRFRLRLQQTGRRPAQTFESLGDAEAVRDAALAELKSGAYVAASRTSLAELGPSFLRARETNRAAKSEKQRWNTHVLTAPFARRPLASVARPDIKRWLDSLKAKRTAHRWGKRPPKPLAFQTRKHCRNLLNAFFAWAIDQDFIASNPVRDVKVTREDGDEEEGYQEGWYLAADAGEQRRLLDMADEQEKWLVAFAMGTGLRLGEQCCLRLEDVVVTGPKPHVRICHGSYDRIRKRYRSTKGRRGQRRPREVPLFGLGLEAAQKWLGLLPSYAPKNPDGLMFPTRRGARRTGPPRTWKRTVERFGVIPRIGRPIWWHLLRHTFASSLIAGWWGERWSLEDIRVFLGHTSVKTTERYAHLAPSVTHAVAARADQAWRDRGHAAVTSSKNPEGNGQNTSPSKPNVVSSNLTGRALSRAISQPFSRRSALFAELVARSRRPARAERPRSRSPRRFTFT